MDAEREYRRLAGNEAVKEGKLDTAYLGKPFGGDAGGLRDFFRAVKTTWKGSK